MSRGHGSGREKRGRSARDKRGPHGGTGRRDGLQPSGGACRLGSAPQLRRLAALGHRRFDCLRVQPRPLDGHLRRRAADSGWRSRGGSGSSSGCRRCAAHRAAPARVQVSSRARSSRQQACCRLGRQQARRAGLGTQQRKRQQQSRGSSSPFAPPGRPPRPSRPQSSPPPAAPRPRIPAQAAVGEPGRAVGVGRQPPTGSSRLQLCSAPPGRCCCRAPGTPWPP